jgi:hypothetical protein
MKRATALLAAAALLLASPASGALVSASAAPRLYENCTNLNKKYPHGLGKLRARDRTTATPVTNFKRSTRLYNLAMSYKPGARSRQGRDRLREGVSRDGMAIPTKRQDRARAATWQAISRSWRSLTMGSGTSALPFRASSSSERAQRAIGSLKSSTWGLTRSALI